MNSELRHYGVLGMKWGVRRFQNADGTLTAEGLRRSSKDRNPKSVTKLKKKVNGIAKSVSLAGRQFDRSFGNQLNKIDSVLDSISSKAYRKVTDTKIVQKGSQQINRLLANPKLSSLKLSSVKPYDAGRREYMALTKHSRAEMAKYSNREYINAPYSWTR